MKKKTKGFIRDISAIIALIIFLLLIYRVGQIYKLATKDNKNIEITNPKDSKSLLEKLKKGIKLE